MTFVLKLSETHETYEVSGFTTLKDPSRCEFAPETAKVIHREGVPWSIEIKGRRIKSDRYTYAYYHIDPEGNIEPHRRNGPAPAWVTYLVESVTRARRLARVTR